MSIMIESPTAETGPATGAGVVVVVVGAGAVDDGDEETVDGVAGTDEGEDGAGVVDGPNARVETVAVAVVTRPASRWARPRPTRANSTAMSTMPMVRSARVTLAIRTSVPCSRR